MSSRWFDRGWQPSFILDTHQLAQLIAPARQTRADCSNWYAEDCRDLIVAHAFKTHEQDGLPLLLRKLIDSSSEVAQLKYGMCVRCHSEKWRRSLHFNPDSLADGAAHVVHMLVVQDSKKPSSQVGPCLPQVLLGDSARQTALDEIVGADRATGQL